MIKSLATLLEGFVVCIVLETSANLVEISGVHFYPVRFKARFYSQKYSRRKINVSVDARKPVFRGLRTTKAQTSL